MKLEETERGFAIIKFKDRYNAPCSLQECSIFAEACIRLGVDDPNPEVLTSKIKKGGKGWVPYPIPDSVHITTSMFLTIKQVEELIPHLQRFVDTGFLRLRYFDEEKG